MDKPVERYVTHTVAEELSPDAQSLIWLQLDNFLVEGTDADYLQIFELKVVIRAGVVLQHIVHRQKQPPFEREVGHFQVDNPHNGTIWIYLDDCKQTMLLPEEW